ncbi:hypothetical protein G9A89_019877 [Geosiphon pyriformis]|nr:hypothetical protein G9A89_019877 [Geosiphon pyriformis]
MEFVFQVSLETAFLVELTSFVHLATLKIAKSLVVSEFGSLSAAVVLYDVPLSVPAANIKTVLSVFGDITYVVLKPTGIWHSQADLDSTIVKTGTLRKYHIWWETPGCQYCFKCQELNHLIVDCKVSLPLSLKFSKMFIPCFVDLKSYAKFINGNLVSSSAFGLRINEVLVHMSSFSRTVNKLGREVIFLKKECCIEDIDMSDNLEYLIGVDDNTFSNLMFLWAHKSVYIKTNPLKTAE